MSMNSPVTPSPGMTLLDWDETSVQAFLAQVGLEQYEDLIYDQGITGDVLAAMDHTTLAEMGMTSVGHRLNLLRAVWELKKEQGVDFGDDDWRPQDVIDVAKTPPTAHVEADRLWDAFYEQQIRIASLEKLQTQLLTVLEAQGLNVPNFSPTASESVLYDQQKKLSHTSRSVVGSDSRFSDDEGYTVRQRPSAHRRASLDVPPSLNSSIASNIPPAPLSSGSATFGDGFTPTAPRLAAPHDTYQDVTSSRSAPVPGRIPMSTDAARDASTPPTKAAVLENTGSDPFLAARTQTALPTSAHGVSPLPHSLNQAGDHGTFTHSSTSTLVVPESHEVSDRDKSQAKDAARSAAKQFRVTLEDPCWKVLPAALKKYKINDDWKQYALFICFDTTERCLSYDEKPLMLFQKLKESGQKPVFMLRHIRDIKSPIAVAQQKQAIKLGLPATTSTDVLPKIKSTRDEQISPTKGNPLAPTARLAEDGQTPQGGVFPELPSPSLREGDATSRSGFSSTGTLTGKEGNTQSVTYAVAIYPYIADRQDEFDVAVGASFVILSKTKGWYIVQKDPKGLGDIVPDQNLSGWVPAGCLLELSVPISLASPHPEGIAPYPGLSPLPPSAIISSSYPGVVLMDYTTKGDKELSLKEGDNVKVYKKYCHWSYTIKQDTGERGWIPAWFIGKISTSLSQASAATPTGSVSVSALPAESMGPHVDVHGEL